jgi:alpha-beta hydrolase superfamily lysophospholipase
MPNTAIDYVVEIDGDLSLTGSLWDVAAARATIVIAHGINEHVGRYAELASDLNKAGYRIIGVDHRGHGRSDNGRARSSNIRRFDDWVDDYLTVTDRVRADYPEPVIALGHSLGGLIAARAALRGQDRLAALIQSGPALKIPTDLTPVKLRLALLLARLVPSLPAPVGGSDGLSRDPGVRERFLADDLCIHEPVRLGIARQLYLLSDDTRALAGEIKLPLLVMHGEADTITDPAGSREFVERASSADKQFIAWPDDQHEIFNELDRDQVIATLVEWLRARY